MKLLWLDMETTGLEIKDGHYPLEIGCVVAKNFTESVEEYSSVIKWDAQKTYFQCIDWCKKAHTENALLYEVENGKPLEIVEQELIDLVQRNFKKGEEVVIAGNSIGSFDRPYLVKWFPNFEKKLHYRMLDVTSWRMGFVGLKIFENVDKTKIDHRVMGDLKESIWEFTRYKDFLVRSQMLSSVNQPY